MLYYKVSVDGNNGGQFLKKLFLASWYLKKHLWFDKKFGLT